MHSANERNCALLHLSGKKFIVLASNGPSSVTRADSVKKGFKTWLEFKNSLLSLWTPNWCECDTEMCQHNHRTHRNDFFCSSLFTQKRSTHNQHQNKHSTTNIASIDMDGMFPESGKNIYISDTSYGYTEIDMINLFGSPAGRAINKITSIKLSKSEAAAKAKAKSKDRINTNGISCSSGSSSSSYRSNDVNSHGTTMVATHSPNRDHTLFGEDQENSIKAISGTVGIDTTFGGVGVGINNGATQTVHRRHCITKPEKYMNLHKKKVKCWEFLENNKLNNNWSCTSTDEHKVERFDELITDAEIYEEAIRFLGCTISCSFDSNSCRCLDCQSRYFDYDDDEDYDDSDDDDDVDDDFITVF